MQNLIDPQQIAAWLQIFMPSGQVTELRALNVVRPDFRRPHTESGYFDDPFALANAAAGITCAKGIYFVPNPIKPALLARAQNHLYCPGQGDSTTTDSDIVSRRWLLVDLDPIRPAGISSSQVEHDMARQKAREITAYLCNSGWPLPICASSGNGFHLLYRIDLPTDDGGLVKNCLEVLADFFDDDKVTVDRKVFNPARIWKLYGTLACKGDNVPERPHRVSKIIYASDELSLVPKEYLKSLVSSKMQGQSTTVSTITDSKVDNTANSKSSFDLEQWIKVHELDVVGPRHWANGGRKWVFNECPWNPEHNDRSAFILQLPNGSVSAGCHHNGCAGKGWHDLRDLVEPGWRNRKGPQYGDKTDKTLNFSDVLSLSQSSFVPYEPFPVELFPEPIQTFLKSGSSALCCDPAYIATPLLAGLSVAIGNTCKIQLKRGWTEPAVIWSAIVGDSGTLKSPAIDLALKFIREKQDEEMQLYKAACEDYERNKDEYFQAMVDWKKNQEGEVPSQPVEPISTRWIVGDITVESLVQILQNSERGLLLLRDELSGWIRSFDQYKSGKAGDAAHWLEMHRAATLIVDRKSSDPKTVYVPHAAVSVTGGIQPEILQRVLGREYFENGLTARLLLAMPPRQPKRWNEQEVDSSVEQAMAGLFKNLLSLQFNSQAESTARPNILHLSDSGKVAWVKFFNEHADEQNALSGDESAAWSKLEGYVARFSLIIHLVRWAVQDPSLENANVIDEKSITCGVKLARWFGNEARRVYAALRETPEAKEIRKLIEMIQRKDGQISVRELMRNGPKAYRKNAKVAEVALQSLAEKGFGVWVDQPSTSHGGRPTKVFVLKVSGDGDKTDDSFVTDQTTPSQKFEIILPTGSLTDWPEFVPINSEDNKGR